MIQIYSSIFGGNASWYIELYMLYYNHSKDKNTKTKEILKMNVQEIAKELRGQDVWSMELLELLCDEADLTEEFKNADSETFESVVYKAADVLNVEI